MQCRICDTTIAVTLVPSGTCDGLGWGALSAGPITIHLQPGRVARPRTPFMGVRISWRWPSIAEYSREVQQPTKPNRGELVRRQLVSCDSCRIHPYCRDSHGAGPGDAWLNAAPGTPCLRASPGRQGVSRASDGG